SVKMKLLLWACVMCVAFAKRKHHPFIHKKSPSPREEDYNGNHYPINPSLNIPFGLWNDNMPPFLLRPLDTHQGNAITKFSGNPEAEKGLSSYPWIPTSSKVRYIYQNPSYPTDTAAPAPPPLPPPPRAYPFVIPPKISVSSVAAEPAAAPAAPAVGDGLVPEFSIDKTISGLPPAIKLEPPPAELRPPAAAEPALGQFGAPETAPAQFGALEPAPVPSGAAEPAATHTMIPEPAPPQSVAAAQAIPESCADQSAENKPASGEPAVAQPIPVEPPAGQAAEAKPPPTEPIAIGSQSVVGKLIPAKPSEVKTEGPEPVEAKPGSQEPQPFLFNQKHICYPQSNSPEKHDAPKAGTSSRAIVTPNSASGPLPFVQFRPRIENVDWRRLGAIDVDKVVGAMDILTLQENIMNITFCKLEDEKCLHCQWGVDPLLLKLPRLV
ncbi:hypothetical protein STEG23_009898, partial [Scotinomys teguina]